MGEYGFPDRSVLFHGEKGEVSIAETIAVAVVIELPTCGDWRCALTGPKDRMGGGFRSYLRPPGQDA